MTIFDQPIAVPFGGVANFKTPQRCSVAAPLTYGVELTFRH